MATTSVSSIKPQNTIKNRVNKVLTKNSLRHLENAAKSYVSVSLCELDWVQEIARATEEEAEAMQVAQVECSRFPSVIGMSCVESLRTSFWPLNGYNTRSKLFLSLKTETLRKGFSMYASGAFRRDEPRKKFPQLETFIHGSYVPDEAGIECEIEWHEIDGVPQMKLLLCTAYAGDKTKWISSALSKNIHSLISRMNEQIMKTGNTS